ncbi:hypothetical protein Pla123a_02220 [Posidoniimonas polymericola]|uniref:Flagellar protein FliL n=1 Tax=Posidoniimonas polymericola TaxID=2528002 RepID=A0A5C5ZE19_9BACT|nr:hypothetical protein [Posidoniimonas polymericola]TWT85415.1 hypothetical protein Pla123a_02220 [Posidoniimonas polymericola]
MTTSSTTRTAVAAAALLLPAAGCYDAAAMIERVRNDAIQSRLEEIDLGDFHVTLPRDETNSETTEVFVDVYGRAVRYRLADIETKLEEEDYSYRQNMLLAVRSTSNEELAEPGLGTLRKRLFEVVNTTLADTPVEQVGIEYIRLVRH